jgi:hypothetical protein
MGICASVNIPASIPQEFVGRWVQDEASLVYNLQQVVKEEEELQDLLQKRADAGADCPDTANGSFAWLVADSEDATVQFTKATARKAERDDAFSAEFNTRAGYRGRIREFGKEKWTSLDGLMPYNFKISQKEYVDFEGTPLLAAFVVNGVRLERVISFEEEDGRTLWLLLSEMAEETLLKALKAIKDLYREVDTERMEIAVHEESHSSDEKCC